MTESIKYLSASQGSKIVDFFFKNSKFGVKKDPFQAMFNFYNDEGFMHPIHREASSRDDSKYKTFVYKFGINRLVFRLTQIKNIIIYKF